MKKVLILAIIAVMSFEAKAQLISSNTFTRETIKPTPIATPTPINYKNYKRIGISYNTISTGQKGADAISGVSLDILKGTNITHSFPLYIESGLIATYGWKTDEKYNYKTSTNYLGLKIPINLTYRFEIFDGFRISPLFGIYFKGNLLGNSKVEYDGEEISSVNIYSKDDMGDAAATRFNFGMDVGVNIEYKSLYFGISYAGDLNNFYGSNGGKMGIFSATLGLVY